MASAASTLAAAAPGCLAAAGRTSALSNRDVRRARDLRVTLPAAHPRWGASRLQIGSADDSTDFASHVRELAGFGRRGVTTCAYGDVVGGTGVLIGGAIAIAILGSAIPAFFLRKNTCPECDGAGFVRSGNTRLVGNAARKDQKQIVCPSCNGLGKLGSQSVSHFTSAMAGLIADTDAWKALEGHVSEIDQTHLRDLLLDEGRCVSLIKELNGTVVDLSRQRLTDKTMGLLLDLAKEAKLKDKISNMFSGEHVNKTENRAVLHVALRAPKNEVIMCDGKNVVPEVHEVLDKIKAFSEKVRSGDWVGATGKPLTDVVCIGIGGSFLGPLFVHTALQTEPKCAEAAGKRQLRFLSNVDPIDIALALDGLQPETTLVVIVSKTFTTAETMLNSRTVRSWIIASLGKAAVAKHMVAVSTNLKLVSEFGIDPSNAFGFWDWVGGRFSVCSAVGVLPLALQYGFDNVEEFLQGAWDVDKHFREESFENNIPVLLGLIGVWNATFLGYPARAILPYCQSLAKLAPHIQQVSMESNGKGVTVEGLPVSYLTGQIDFGEPGTNGQHSFYQLIHQGRVIPCDFIGIIKSHHSVYVKGELVSNHDELMCNFFAQPDALAYGKTSEQLVAEGVTEALVTHKTFTGNRPSLSILLPRLTPYTVGQLLAVYEHQVAVQGFIWGINSFDQWGVELGKVLALKVRKQVNWARTEGAEVTGFNASTNFLLNRYLKEKEEIMKTFD